MKIRYSISPRSLPRGIPFWVLPLVLFILLVAVLLWSLFSLHFSSSTKFFDQVKSSLTSQSSDVKNQYVMGLTNFRNRSYYTAGKQFQAIEKNPYAPQSLRQTSLLYYAFSLLLYGESQRDGALIQGSKDIFEQLVHSFPMGNPLYSRAMWGYARAARYLNSDYLPETGATLWQFAQRASSDNLKRSLYLELGYYYFKMNDYQKAFTFFSRSASLVSSSKFYEEALTKEGAEILLLQLLRTNRIPEQILYSYGPSIAQKSLNLVIRNMSMGQYKQADGILGILIRSFRTEEILENLYFFAGYSAQKENRLGVALNYYQRVVSNGYLDKDPAAYFNMAVIFWNLQKKETAREYFELVASQYTYTYYGIQAQKWLNAMGNREGTNDFPITPTTPEIPSAPIVSSQDSYPHFSNLPKQQPAPGRRREFPKEEVERVQQQQQPQKPIVNVNINQNRSFVTDSNNTQTSLSRNEKDARNVTYSSSRENSENTLTSLSKEDNSNSSTHSSNSSTHSTPDNAVKSDNPTPEPESLEKDFENSYVPMDEAPQNNDDLVLFESKRDPNTAGGTEGSSATRSVPTQNDLARDFDDLSGDNTAGKAR